ncbi:MAG: RNA-binding protein [Hyphomicrobium sp.]
MGAEQQPKDNDTEVEPQGSLRRCIVTRAERPPENLIRFVAGPDDVIVPDLARRLPGQGVWVTAELAAVESAIKAKAFSKGLRRQVTASPDLARTVEALILKRVLQALSLANKAGFVSSGFEKVEALVSSGCAAVLLHGADAAAGGQHKLDRKFTAIQRDKGKVAPIVDWLTIEQLSLAIGRSNVVHAGLTKGGAAKWFLSEAERLRRYRLGLGAP